MHLAIKIVISIIILSSCLFCVFYYYYTSYNNGYRGDFKETTPGGGSGRALVVFQPSRDGVSTQIARQIAKGIGAGGYEVTISHPGKHLPVNLKQYAILAFGSPVYFASVSSALTGYIKNVEAFSEGKIAIYTVGNLKESPEIEIIEKCFKGAILYKKEKFIATDVTTLERSYEFGVSLAK